MQTKNSTISMAQCLKECRLNPVVKKSFVDIKSIRELLLSRAATQYPEGQVKLELAIDQLIALENPIINVILEIAAYYVHQNKLFIYITDHAGVHQFDVEAGTQGFFNANHNIIMISQSSESVVGTFIHELTHAVTHFVFGNSNPSASRDHRNALQPNHYSQHLERESDFVTGKSMDDVEEYIPGVTLIRSKLFSSLTINYKPEDHEAEYLPHLLQHFVVEAIRRPITARRQQLVDQICERRTSEATEFGLLNTTGFFKFDERIREEESTRARFCEQALLFSLACEKSMPDSSKIIRHCKDAFDIHWRYLASPFLAKNDIASLEDSISYSVSFPEIDHRINPNPK